MHTREEREEKERMGEWVSDLSREDEERDEWKEGGGGGGGIVDGWFTEERDEKKEEKELLEEIGSVDSFVFCSSVVYRGIGVSYG